MSTALREGITRLEVTSRVTLGVLALASGVYTYLGVRELLNGNATVVFFAAVIYSVAVSVGILRLLVVPDAVPAARARPCRPRCCCSAPCCSAR